jgi:hypothetical protein
MSAISAPAWSGTWKTTPTPDILYLHPPPLQRPRRTPHPPGSLLFGVIQYQRVLRIGISNA